MQRCTQGNYGSSRDWLEFTQKCVWNSPDFMVGSSGANLLRGLVSLGSVNLIGIIALRSNPPLASPRGPAPGYRRSALLGADRPCASSRRSLRRRSHTRPCLRVPASPVAPAALSFQRLGLKTQSNNGIPFSSTCPSLGLVLMVSAGAVLCRLVWFPGSFFGVFPY